MNRRRFSPNIFLLFVLLLSSNTTLPQVQFCFTATVVNGNDVLIEWTWGIREVNDYGFYVQRRVQGEPEFEDLPNSFVPMHDSSYYYWIDEDVPPGDYEYRLRKVDLDGSMLFSCIVSVSVGSRCRGVPDPFGYRWIDSDEPDGPRFGWINIIPIGTQLLLGDDQVVGPFAIGFPFPFYGNTYDSIFICSNGWLSFLRTNFGDPRCALYLYFTDLVVYRPPFAYGSVHYYRDSVNQRLIIQYTNVVRYGSVGSSYTFQVILTPDGNILYQYLQMLGPIDGFVGIRNCDGTAGNFYTCQVRDSLAILFTRGTTNVSASPNGIPVSFSLHQNYPNPFNPVTEIRFQIAEVGLVTLKVFDLLGREVATLVNEVKQPGRYEVTWDADGVSSGVYLYRLQTGSFAETKKLILVR